MILQFKTANKLFSVWPYSFPKTYSLGYIKVHFLMSPFPPWNTVHECSTATDILLFVILCWEWISDVIVLKNAYFHLMSIIFVFLSYHGCLLEINSRHDELFPPLLFRCVTLFVCRNGSFLIAFVSVICVWYDAICWTSSTWVFFIV